MDRWRWIPGYECAYEVNRRGQVRTYSGHPLKPETDKRGYQRVSLKRKHRFIHQLVALAFIGPKPAGLVINHKDGNPANNTPENLEYVTQSENIRHAYQVLKRPPHHQGEKTHFAKLTEADVVAIRKLRLTGLTYKDIAACFNTKPANVWHICSGKTWKHLLL